MFEALDLFDFDQYDCVGRIDYLLGAEPDGGVYVIGRCDDPLQSGYMEYYKMGSGPYYLFTALIIFAMLRLPMLLRRQY